VTNIFAYTPLEIMPAYLSINCRPDNNVYATIRSNGERLVSEIVLPEKELERLYQCLHLYLGKDYI
jgi:hypothetical protein